MGINIIGLSSIYEGNKNNYDCLNKLNSKNGIYIFNNTKTQDILYIGSAKDQPLNKRIKQNFTEKNSGGTFRKNYMNNSQTFSKFKELISDSEILTISGDNGLIILALEALLIAVLKPKYNK